MPEQKDRNLMAGHAPATIVGGMRISNPKAYHPKEATSNNSSANKEKDTSQDEPSSTTDDSNTSAASDTAVIQQSKDHSIIVDGMSIRIEDAFPAEAVKRFHEKPLPTHDIKQHAKQIQMHHINQPRKF